MEPPRKSPATGWKRDSFLILINERPSYDGVLTPTRFVRGEDEEMAGWSCQAAFILALCIPMCACTDLYVKLADSSARPAQPCGNNVTTACASIAVALDAFAPSGKDPSPPTNVKLLHSVLDQTIRREVLTDVTEVIIDGGATLMAFEKFYHPQQPWLEVQNSSQVTFRNFSITVTSWFTGSSLMMFKNCYNVTVTSGMVLSGAYNSRPMVFEDSWPVLVSQISFVGNETYFDPPSVNEVYNLSAIHARYTCDPISCDVPKRTPDTHNPNCCQGQPAKSSLNPSLLVEDCQFHHLGIKPKYHMYYRKQVGGGVSVHLEILSVHNVSVFIRQCHFVNISSPYDSNINVHLEGTTQNSLVSIEESRFENGWLYIGGGLLYHLEGPVKLNKLFITGCNFSKNTGYIEGGAVALSYAGSIKGEISRNVAVVRDCIFTENEGGPLFGVDVVGGAITFIATASLGFPKTLNKDTTYPRLTVVNSQFIRNAASCGSAMYFSKGFVHLHNL